MDANVQWEAVTGVFAGLTWLLLALAALVGYRQLKEIARARALEALERVHSELHTEGAKRDRGILYASRLDELSPEQIQGLSAEERILVERVCDSWHHVAILVHHRLVKSSVLFEYFGEPALRSYKKLKGYIQHTKRQRGRGYGSHIDALAADFERRFKEAYGQQEFQRLFDATTLAAD